MKISESAILMTSQHQAAKRVSVKQSLRVWIGNRPAESNRNGQTGAVEVSISPQARRRAASSQTGQSNSTAAASRTEKDSELAAADISDPVLRMVKLLFEKIFGQKFSLFDIAQAQADAEAPPAQTPSAAAQPDGAQAAPNWGAEFDYQESYYEAEATTVSAAGIIKTTDGQEIEFQLDLSMSREFMANKSINMRLGNAATTDPLVVNFDGTAAQLSDTKFLFDLDVDGQKESISQLESNSGYLALDKNGDGQINNGSELFGPTTGQGFAELANYDDDGNQWIDENDAVFSQLRIWTQDGSGAGQLSSLADKGIGALYLSPVSSEFAVKNSQNDLQGQVRSSSLYVNENGSVGAVQQLDLAV